MRNLTMCPPEYLLITDFDGTVADTFSQSPRGIGVHEAYAVAVEQLFGPQGLAVYDKIGGLKNRAPMELVGDIFRKTKDSRSLIQEAKGCFESRGAQLGQLVPKGKGVSISEWDLERIQEIVGEMLVRLKLECLMNEIGQSWPLPCQGFSEFYRFLEFLTADVEVGLAVMSSGHDEFIKETFRVWGWESPCVMVTDDDLRGLSYPENPKDRCKPSRFALDLVQANYMGTDPNAARRVQETLELRQRMMYFGDDSNKDGGLAKNSGVPFGFFDPKRGSIEVRGSTLRFSNWTHVSRFFQKRLDLFRFGKSFSEIISS